jgi:hypothetical protein
MRCQRVGLGAWDAYDNVRPRFVSYIDVTLCADSTCFLENG